MVWIDGLLVIDSWEGVATAAAVSTGSAASILALPKLSGCVTVPPSASNAEGTGGGQTAAVITVAFSGASLEASPLQLTWAKGCGGSSAAAMPQSAFSSLAGAVSTSTAWIPRANTAGRRGC
jgi:hypothetical protein